MACNERDQSAGEDGTIRVVVNFQAFADGIRITIVQDAVPMVQLCHTAVHDGVVIG